MQTTVAAPQTHLPGKYASQWTLPRLVMVLVLVNVVIAALAFVARPPWRTPVAEAPGSELPPQVRELQRRIADGRPGEPYVLNLSDAELTATAGYFAAAAPDVPFTRIQVAVVGDRVVVNAVTRGLAIPVPVRAIVLLTAAEGAPAARVEDVRVAGAGLPAFARDQVLREANASLDLSQYRLPVTVDSLDLATGGLVIRGRLT
jgi:DUF2993 family protein